MAESPTTLHSSKEKSSKKIKKDKVVSLQRGSGLVWDADSDSDSDAEEDEQMNLPAGVGLSAAEAKEMMTEVQNYVLEYVDSIIPDVFDRSTPLLQRLWSEICTHHMYFNAVFPWYNRKHQSFMSQAFLVLQLLTIQTFSMFLQAALYELQSPDDDGSCVQFVTKQTCEHRTSVFDSSRTYCQFDNVKQRCLFNKNANKSPQAMLYVIILSGVIVSLFRRPIELILIGMTSPVFVKSSPQKAQESSSNKDVNALDDLGHQLEMSKFTVKAEGSFKMRSNKVLVNCGSLKEEEVENEMDSDDDENGSSVVAHPFDATHDVASRRSRKLSVEEAAIVAETAKSFEKHAPNQLMTKPPSFSFFGKSASQKYLGDKLDLTTKAKGNSSKSLLRLSHVAFPSFYSQGEESTALTPKSLRTSNKSNRSMGEGSLSRMLSHHPTSFSMHSSHTPVHRSHRKNARRSFLVNMVVGDPDHMLNKMTLANDNDDRIIPLTSASYHQGVMSAFLRAQEMMQHAEPAEMSMTPPDLETGEGWPISQHVSLKPFSSAKSDSSWAPSSAKEGNEAVMVHPLSLDNGSSDEELHRMCRGILNCRMENFPAVANLEKRIFDNQWGVRVIGRSAESLLNTHQEFDAFSESTLNVYRDLLQDIQSDVDRLEPQIERWDSVLAGIEMLHLFLIDLLGHKTKSAIIFFHKFNEDFEKVQHVSYVYKYFCFSILLGFNAFFIYYVLLRGVQKGLDWQHQYVISMLIQLLLDIFLFETFECLSLNYAIPQTVRRDVRHAAKVLYDLAKDPHLLMDEASFLAEQAQLTEKEESGEFFNAPSFLFLSTRIAKLRPGLLESRLILSYRNHFPGLICRTWPHFIEHEKELQQKAEQHQKLLEEGLFVEEDEDDDQASWLVRCVVRLHKTGLLVSLFVATTTAGLLQTIGILPMETQKQVLRLLATMFVSCLSMLWYYAIAHLSLFSVVASLALIGVVWLVVHYYVRPLIPLTSREERVGHLTAARRRKQLYSDDNEDDDNSSSNEDDIIAMEDETGHRMAPSSSSSSVVPSLPLGQPNRFDYDRHFTFDERSHTPLELLSASSSSDHRAFQPIITQQDTSTTTLAGTLDEYFQLEANATASVRIDNTQNMVHNGSSNKKNDFFFANYGLSLDEEQNDSEDTNGDDDDDVPDSLMDSHFGDELMAHECDSHGAFDESSWSSDEI